MLKGVSTLKKEDKKGFGETIIPLNYLEIKGPAIFLAGPVRGAIDWQTKAIDYIREKSPKMHVFSPRWPGPALEDFPDDIFDNQVDWEHFHLQRAGENGVILFWLAREVEHNCQRAYAQTTRFEIGEAVAIHRFTDMKVVVGIEKGFTGERYIRRTLSKKYPGVFLCDNLEETCELAIRLAQEEEAKWLTVERPSYLGKNRDKKYQQWNEKYGKDNWRLAWQVGEIFVDFLGVCALYEDAYFEFLTNNPSILKQLISQASEVYDDELSNVNSGFDYKKQETKRTHIQDIAIRRSLIRMGRWFHGEELIRIRQEKGTHLLSVTLSPGRVPFHRSDLIKQPEIEGWWHLKTVEAFYQSNRFLQTKEAC